MLTNVVLQLRNKNICKKSFFLESEKSGPNLISCDSWVLIYPRGIACKNQKQWQENKFTKKSFFLYSWFLIQIQCTSKGNVVTCLDAFPIEYPHQRRATTARQKHVRKILLPGIGKIWTKLDVTCQIMWELIFDHILWESYAKQKKCSQKNNHQKILLPVFLIFWFKSMHV